MANKQTREEYWEQANIQAEGRDKAARDHIATALAAGDEVVRATVRAAERDGRRTWDYRGHIDRLRTSRDQARFQQNVQRHAEWLLQKQQTQAARDQVVAQRPPAAQGQTQKLQWPMPAQWPKKVDDVLRLFQTADAGDSAAYSLIREAAAAGDGTAQGYIESRPQPQDAQPSSSESVAAPPPVAAAVGTPGQAYRDRLARLTSPELLAESVNDTSSVQDRGQQQAPQPQQQQTELSGRVGDKPLVERLTKQIYYDMRMGIQDDGPPRELAALAKKGYPIAAKAMSSLQDWTRRTRDQAQASQSSNTAIVDLTETMQGNQVTSSLQRAQTMPATPASGGGERRALPSEAQTPSSDLYGDSTRSTPQPAVNQSRQIGSLRPPLGEPPYLDRGGPVRAGCGQGPRENPGNYRLPNAAGQPLRKLVPRDPNAPPVQPSMVQSLTWPTQTRAGDTRAAQNISKQTARNEDRGGPSTQKAKSSFNWFGGKKTEASGPSAKRPALVNTAAPKGQSGNSPISISTHSDSSSLPSPTTPAPSSGKGKGKAPAKKGWGRKK